MTIRSCILFGVVGLTGGLLFSLILLFILPKISLSPENPIYKYFGITKPRIVGFQPYWLLDKADKNYIPYLTTYAYYGLALDNDGTVVKLANADEEDPGWTTLKGENLNKRMKQAKSEHLNLSLLVYTSKEATISSILEDPKKSARNLVADIEPVMKKFGFTDLNLDIESFKEATEGSRLKFTAFVDSVKKELVQNKLGTLTLDISPSAFVKSFIINPADIGGIADFIILMAYDYHYSGSFLSGPVAPIGGVGKYWEFDVESGIREALKTVPPHKIILGIPLYGYEWETLSDKPNSAVIPGGSSTASNRRAEKLLSECKNCVKSTDEVHKETSIVFPDPDGDFFHQIFYEDKDSLSRKIELVRKYNLGGIALWALGYEGDDILSPLLQYKKFSEFKM